MEQDTMLVCGNCNSTVAVSSVKYNSTGDYLICKKCYNKEHDKIDVDVEDEINAELKKLEVRMPQKKARPMLHHMDYARVNYQCTHCGYKYSRKKDADYNRQCPYCSKNAVEVLNRSAVEDVDEDTAPSVFFSVDNLLN